jgi:hypothetical protein
MKKEIKNAVRKLLFFPLAKSQPNVVHNHHLLVNLLFQQDEKE